MSRIEEIEARLAAAMLDDAGSGSIRAFITNAPLDIGYLLDELKAAREAIRQALDHKTYWGVADIGGSDPTIPRGKARNILESALAEEPQ